MFGIGFEMHPSSSLLVWWAALLSLGIYSFLYRDNVLYKYIEHLFLGVSAGFWFTRTFWNVFYDKVWVAYVNFFTAKGADKVHYLGNFLLMTFGVLMGVLMLTRLIPKLAWISRIPLSLIVGFTASIYIYTSIQSNILPQIGHTLLPLIEPNIGSVISSAILIVGVLTSLLYFYFSVEQKGAMIPLTRLGIMFLMVTFGASFGYSVMARVSLVVNTFKFLISDWLGMTITF